MNAELGLDVAALEKLGQIGDREFVVQMIDLFLKYVPEKLAEAHAAAQAGDLVGVQKAVHPIKSSAGNIGASPMRALAAHIEQLAIDQRGESIAALLGELDAAYAQVQSQLEKKREALAAAGKEGVL